jgi:iron(III) transport system substrate-binding protein
MVRMTGANSSAVGMVGRVALRAPHCDTDLTSPTINRNHHSPALSRKLCGSNALPRRARSDAPHLRLQIAKNLIAHFSFLLVVAVLLTSCGKSSNGNGTVTVYTSQDEEYADPLFKLFEAESGIRVLAVYDSEAVKTVGLANRILAEQSNPQCDVFWNNEELRTRLLASKNVFEKTNGWVQLGYRTRRLAINSNLVANAAAAPVNFSDATNAIWRGKVALAYPLFGTTATHFLALRQYWGDAAWREWCKALVANKPFLVDGNSVAAKLVGTGEAIIGFTDSDDAMAEQREGNPVALVPIGNESLVIYNTAGVVRGCPHQEAAEKFMKFLRRPETQQTLVGCHALESPAPADPNIQEGMHVDWDKLIAELDTATDELKEIFLR